MLISWGVTHFHTCLSSGWLNPRLGFGCQWEVVRFCSADWYSNVHMVTWCDTAYIHFSYHVIVNQFIPGSKLINDELCHHTCKTRQDSLNSSLTGPGHNHIPSRYENKWLGNGWYQKYVRNDNHETNDLWSQNLYMHLRLRLLQVHDFGFSIGSWLQTWLLLGCAKTLPEKEHEW